MARVIHGKIIHQLVFPEKVELLLSAEIQTEYSKVIAYKKFEKHSWYHEQSIGTLKELFIVAKIITTTSNFNLSSDKDDNKFLDLAYAGNADFLITGNNKHFPFGKFENTEIISPQKYWNTYWK